MRPVPPERDVDRLELDPLDLDPLDSDPLDFALLDFALLDCERDRELEPVDLVLPRPLEVRPLEERPLEPVDPDERELLVPRRACV